MSKMDPVMVAEVWELGTGRISNVHLGDTCEAPCPIHSPTDHQMRKFRLLYRDDRGIFERLCEHGVGHPDPDNMAYFTKMRGPDHAQGIHGCDGCCRHE
jgi:hypothetical protein